MKIAVISDIHGNLFALKEVLKDIKKLGITIILSLGDIIGYGPFTNECLDLNRETATYTCIGNHEIGVFDKELFESWTINSVAISALDITRNNISKNNLAYIKSLPSMIEIPDLDITMAHGNISNSSAFKYVRDEIDRRTEYLSLKTKIGIVGHTHIPFVFCKRTYRENFELKRLVFPKDSKILLNPGSVGFPRDRNPKASYCILEYTEKEIIISNRRVEYDVEKTISMLNKIGLPKSIGKRMRIGS